jgi:hypothetical protein
LDDTAGARRLKTEFKVSQTARRVGAWSVVPTLLDLLEATEELRKRQI